MAWLCIGWPDSNSNRRFTNLTQDHLDFHKTMENYFQAKMKLFEDYAEDGAAAVINADIPEFEKLPHFAPHAA